MEKLSIGEPIIGADAHVLCFNARDLNTIGKLATLAKMYIQAALITMYTLNSNDLDPRCVLCFLRR